MPLVQPVQPFVLRATVAAAVLPLLAACVADPAALLSADSSAAPDPATHELLARIAHVSDTHMLDEESPARFAGAHQFLSGAWRPQEAYSAQVLDGIVRTVNRFHAHRLPVDFLIHTGDACDNAQQNELGWFLSVMDGAVVTPRTGPDDRDASDRPDLLLDPHQPFETQGLYRDGIHGPEPSIPWYVVLGNHDVYAQGVFAIFQQPDGSRIAPLPLDERPGIVLPVVFDPLSPVAFGNVTPAQPGPPRLFESPRSVPVNPDRRFFDRSEFIDAMFATDTEPPGHGFAAAPTGSSWYSLSPLPGLRLIGLDTTDASHKIEGFPYHDGSISRSQAAFLQAELDRADANGELVIVASHHPSAFLQPIYGTALDGPAFRDLLNAHPCVVLHLAGHSHVHRVTDRGGYIEIETGSTIDAPQEARILEIWRDTSPASADIVIAYETLSHVDESLPPLGDDPLFPLRQTALALANQNIAPKRLPGLTNPPSPTEYDPLRGTSSPYARAGSHFEGTRPQYQAAARSQLDRLGPTGDLIRPPPEPDDSSAVLFPARSGLVRIHRPTRPTGS